MISRLTAAAALVALAPLTAQAADMPYPRPYAAPSYYSWNGTYAGVNVGYGWGRSTWEAVAFTVDPAGWNAGFTLGVNWQAGNIVYGLEGDIDFTDMRRSGSCGAFTCETKNGWLGTARARIGYAFDRFLPYVTGGLAVGDVNATTSNPGFVGNHSTQYGWTVGVGIEAAVSASWSAKLEYLYVDLGTFDCRTCAAVPSNVGFSASMIRIGLNYRFSGPIYSRW